MKDSNCNEKDENLFHQFKNELMNNNPNSDGNPHPQKGKLNLKKSCLAIASILIPILGVVSFFVYKKKNNPILAKLTLTCAIIGFIFNWTISGSDSDSSNSDSSYNSEESYINSYSDDSYSDNSYSDDRHSHYSFNSELDVRTFLTSHTFVDESGNRIEFVNMGNSLIMNGRTMTSSLTVTNLNPNKATLICSGPYGRSRFLLAVEGGEAGIMDYNDYSTYKCRL